MADAAAAYRAAFLEGLMPEQRGTAGDWADQFRVLSQVGSPEPGPWRTDRVPYLAEPMAMLAPRSGFRRVVCVFGSQLGKTEAGLNWLGSVIHWRPAPMLLVMPTLEMAKRLNRQRLEPLIRETSALASRIPPPRARDSGNTTFMKVFPGGLYVLTGANSPSSAQSMPAAYLWADEISSFPIEMKDKGDPLENFEARIANFPNGKALLTSTPGLEGACRISKEFETRSDKRRYNVPCPACGVPQVLIWEQFKWETPESEVFYECPHCGERIEERYKRVMLPAGVWVPTAKGDGITAGYHLPKWYAPLGWTCWEECRDQFLRAKRDRVLLKGWKNKVAAEAFKDEIAQQFNADGLAKRRMDESSGNGYGVGVVPAGVLLITGGVDVQGGGGSVGERIVVTLWGWGAGEEGWHLGHWEIHGDPQQLEVWEQLDAVAATAWRREDGRELRLTMGGIDDGGHAPHQVREYCRTRPQWVPMKGSGTPGRPIVGRGSPVDVTARNKARIRGGVLLYTVGTTASITHLQGRLRNEITGPGYLHLGQCSTDQFLAELFPWKQRPKMSRGFSSFEWFLPDGCSDEGGDCTRMAYVALLLVMRRYNRATMWEQLEQQVGGMLPSQPARARREEVADDAPAGVVADGGVGRGRGGWLSGGGGGRGGWLRR